MQREAYVNHFQALRNRLSSVWRTMHTRASGMKPAASPFYRRIPWSGARKLLPSLPLRARASVTESATVQAALAVTPANIRNVVGVGSAALGLYVLYWVLVARGMPRTAVPDAMRSGRFRRWFIAIAFWELFIVYVAPVLAPLWAGWRGAAGVALLHRCIPLSALYFLPNMLMTLVNIRLEGYYRHRKRYLVVYSSIAVNNLWRLLCYGWVLADTHRRLTAAPQLSALWAFHHVAWAGVVISVIIMIVFEPAVLAALFSPSTTTATRMTKPTQPSR
ncbi:hypothetical protein CDCA_CDCA11G3214 [Cyanidium caldarium]|uniref:Uncharacterized protein n=1 Tax=Cyanidium caldarium TaxID=2771 RepID=A0AAV9IY26_CYACA|nr:hypothetical protein CDCA_CDCA11G3214 [Cyanidium caldarium]